MAYEAADVGLLSPELAAGIRRVKGVRRIGVRLGNWLTPEQGRRLSPSGLIMCASVTAQASTVFPHSYHQKTSLARVSVGSQFATGAAICYRRTIRRALTSTDPLEAEGTHPAR